MHPNGFNCANYNLLLSEGLSTLIVGELKMYIVQKRKFFAPERYTAGFLLTDS